MGRERAWHLVEAQSLAACLQAPASLASKVSRGPKDPLHTMGQGEGVQGPDRLGVMIM